MLQQKTLDRTRLHAALDCVMDRCGMGRDADPNNRIQEIERDIRSIEEAPGQMTALERRELATLEREKKELLAKTRDADENGYHVLVSGGSIGGKGNGYVSGHPTLEEAKAKAKRMNALLTPGEKGYYKMKYSVSVKKPDYAADSYRLTAEDEGLLSSLLEGALDLVNGGLGAMTPTSDRK